MPTYGLYLSTLVYEFSGIYVRKLSNIYQFFIVLILFTGILALVFINHYKKSNEKEYLNENISTLGISYQSSIDKYRLLSKYIFNESINNKLVLSLFEKGINSTDDEKKLYKGATCRFPQTTNNLS